MDPCGCEAVAIILVLTWGIKTSKISHKPDGGPFTSPYPIHADLQYS